MLSALPASYSSYALWPEIDTAFAPAVWLDGDTMTVHFDRFGIDQYDRFLQLKRLPESIIEFNAEEASYTVTAPARFAAMLGVERPARPVSSLPFAEFLFEDQDAIVKMALDTKRFACWSDCGLGKGLLPECPVLTPTGFVPLQDLAVGDLVVGANGKPTEIVGYFPRGVQPIYQVTFCDGTSVTCDADHLWNVKSYNDVARDKPWRTISTKELAATQLKYGTHGQSRTWQIPLVAPVEMSPATSLPLDPYLLGVLLGDGNLSGTVSWCKADKEIAERIRGVLPPDAVLSLAESSDRCDIWRITGANHGKNPVLDVIRYLGLDRHRSWEKFVPEQYLLASIESRLALLQGLMDTDGYAGESPEFCSTSERLADAVVQLVESLGGTTSKSIKADPRYISNGERKTGRTAYRIVMTLPEGINPFWLPRKANAYKTASRGLGRWIDSIEPCGEARTICIKVAADDGLFVIDRHIVTHNTIIELEFARHVIHRTGGKVLIFTLNEIVDQIIGECHKFYGDSLPIVKLNSREEMKAWCRAGGSGLAITNYEKMNHGKDDQIVNELRLLAGVILDESSRLKGGGGKQKWALIKSCRGIEFKLSCTATPAPNDIMEFASQAAFLEKMRNDKEIIWTFFQRDEKTHRWTVRPHARQAFFEFMSGWSIYVRDPKRYGWRLNHPEIPAPIVTVHPIEPTPEQFAALAKMSTAKNGQLSFMPTETNTVQRSRLSQIAKGFRYRKGTTGRSVQRIPSNKPKFVADLIRSEVAQGLQVLVWTVFDAESDIIAEELRELGVPFEMLTGRIKPDDRTPILERFRRGQSRVLISRASMLGYGMNFQMCGSMIFSGWSDSYEAYYQAIRRAYRFGQQLALRVHLPCVEAFEGDQLENIFGKEAQHLAAIAEMENNYIAAVKTLRLTAV